MNKKIKIKQIFASTLAMALIIGSLFGSSVFAYSRSLSEANPSVLAATTPAPADNSAFSGSKDSVCNGVGLGGNACSNPKNGQSGISKIISNVLDILSYIVGIASVFVLIISGIRMIVSGGDSNSFNSAKNGILYAVIGLVIVAVSQIIVQYVITKTTN